MLKITQIQAFVFARNHTRNLCTHFRLWWKTVLKEVGNLIMALRYRIRSITNENHWSDLNKDKRGAVDLSEDTGDMGIM